MFTAFRDFDDKVCCASWNGDGKTLAVISRSQLVSIVDPRNSTSIIAVIKCNKHIKKLENQNFFLPTFKTTSSHAGIGRENRVLYLGDSGKFITSGFTKVIRLFISQLFFDGRE